MKCAMSLFAVHKLLSNSGIEYDVQTINGCPCIPVARNTLVAMFLQDPDATDLFFIDSDVGFDASAVLKILEREEEIVAGIYPLKEIKEGYPVEVKTIDGRPIGRDGLIEADFLPAGFMRIKRGVFYHLMGRYPELKYNKNVIRIDGSGVEDAYDYFNMGVNGDGQQYRTEDFAFCKRWRDIGGQLWVYPDVQFEHVGKIAHHGNYHQFLLKQPGGSEQPPYDLRKSKYIPGWMSLHEMQWLALKASKCDRVLEIGSAYGRSTRAMADNMGATAILFAADRWGKGIEEKFWGSGEAPVAEDEFFKNLKDHIESGKVFPIKGDHADLKEFPLSTFDLIYVDGDHTYESSKRDIELSLEKINPGGTICGHDADWDGVKKAVKESLPGAINIPGTKLWAWSKA